MRIVVCCVCALTDWYIQVKSRKKYTNITPVEISSALQQRDKNVFGCLIHRLAVHLQCFSSVSLSRHLVNRPALMTHDGLTINLGSRLAVPFVGCRVVVCAQFMGKRLRRWHHFLSRGCWRDSGDGGRAHVVARNSSQDILRPGSWVLGECIGTTAVSGRWHGRSRASARAVAGAVGLGLGISSSTVAHGGSAVAFGGKIGGAAGRRLAVGGVGDVRHGACAANGDLRGTSHHIRIGFGGTVATSATEEDSTGDEDKASNTYARTDTSLGAGRKSSAVFASIAAAAAVAASRAVAGRSGLGAAVGLRDNKSRNGLGARDGCGGFGIGLASLRVGAGDYGSGNRSGHNVVGDRDDRKGGLNSHCGRGCLGGALCQLGGESGSGGRRRSSNVALVDFDCCSLPDGLCGDIRIAAGDGDCYKICARGHQSGDSGRADGGSTGRFGIAGDSLGDGDGGVAAAAATAAGGAAGSRARGSRRGSRARRAGTRRGRASRRSSACCLLLTADNGSVGGGGKSRNADKQGKSHIGKSERMDRGSAQMASD